MCNHYRIGDPAGIMDFASPFAQEDVCDSHADSADWQQNADVRPWSAGRLPVVYEILEGRTLGFLRWGIWPFYAQVRPKSFAPTCNARDDSLLSKSIWKSSAVSRRCLVPADGFYEWAGPKGAKWEVLFQIDGGRPFFFAGIWSPDPSGNDRGFALVTCAPNPQIAALPHDRMPVLLNATTASSWIGADPLPPDQLRDLCQPYAGTLERIDQPRAATFSELDLGP